MKNLNNHFEEKLKERLVEHEFDFDPQAWSSLNKKLNTHNPRRSPLWISSLLTVTLVATILSVAWYTPFEPIQEFFENVFDIQEEVEKEKPVYTPQTVPTKKSEVEEEIIIEKNNTPTKSKKETKTPVAPLPQMGPPDLWEELRYKIETQNAKPIASLSTLVEEEDGEITPIDLPIRRKVKAGFFGGGTVAVSNSPLIPAGAVSPGIGVFAGYNLNDKWSVQAEVNFRKGFVQPFTPKEHKEDYVQLPTLTNQELTPFDRVVENEDVIARNLTVLEFPVLAKYKMNEKSSLMAGVRTSWIYVKDPNSDNSNLETRRNPIYEKVDLGITVGYEIQVTKRVAVDLRYNQGVTDLFQENEDVYLNNDFQASVRYTLNP